MCYTHSLFLNLRLSERVVQADLLVQGLLYNASETTQQHYTFGFPELSLIK